MGLLAIPHPADLSQAGWRAICLFALCVTMWVSSIIPLAITSLMAIALIPLLGITDVNTAYSYFGSKAVFFILGAFTLGAAVVGCGLSTRVTMLALERFAHTPRRLVMTIFLFTAAGSTLMSEHAVAAMAFPIVWEVAQALNLRTGRSNMGKALFFALAWGCVAGGALTILGGGRGPLAIGILEKTTHGQSTVTFMEYILLDAPMVLALLAAAWWTLSRRYPPEIDSVEHAIGAVRDKIHAMGKMSLREKLVAINMVITVGLWATIGEEIGIANIAILSTAALFVLNLVTWRDIEENVNWGVLLMYGGAITLGSTMAETGAAQWLTGKMLGGWHGQPELLMLALACLTAVLTEFMSNSAVIAILMPAALSLAEPAGIDPRLMTMAVVLPSNLAFALPMATPATAMAYSSGHFSPREGIANGIRMDVVGIAGMAFLIFVYWPLLRSLGWM